MRNVTRVAGAAAVFSFVLASVAVAQGSGAARRTATATQGTKTAAPGGGFGVGYTDIGPVIGLGGIGDAGLSIGGRFEHGFKPLPDLGDGVLGIQAGFDWYSYDLGVFGSISYIPIGVTANYHFKMDNAKFDPFLGLGLGYYIVSTPSCGTFGCGSYNSGIYFIGRAGARYFMNPNIALYADAGTGAGALHLGAMFKLKGKN
jgi:hypothetical protein